MELQFKFHYFLGEYLDLNIYLEKIFHIAYLESIWLINYLFSSYSFVGRGFQYLNLLSTAFRCLNCFAKLCKMI